MIDRFSVFKTISGLCQGDYELLHQWLKQDPKSSLLFCLSAIFLGCGSYGFTMGLWQGWEMATYVGIKLPFVIFATLLINGMINGMLAITLGSGISFRQSFQFLLIGFSLMSLILLSLSPITFFVSLHAPSPETSGAEQWHSVTLLTHTFIVAYAGIVSHKSLLGHVKEFASSSKLGAQTFFAWLAGNLFVGAQVSWVMRPFFGSPGLEVQFLRDNPLQGGFYEALWTAIQRLLF